MYPDTNSIRGWVNVYLVDTKGKRTFKRQVPHPNDEVGMRALHARMCRELSTSPASPLEMGRVYLDPFPPN